MPERYYTVQNKVIIGISLIKKEGDIEEESMKNPRSIFTLLSSGRNNSDKQFKKRE